MQKYCEKCKINDEGVCLAGYKNPTTDHVKALNQVKNKGEWPCTFAPHRPKFMEKIVLKQNEWQKLKGLKKGAIKDAD